MTSRSTPSAFLKSTLQNGVGRYVCQLQRITFKFCKSWAGSRGTRDFIEKYLVDFSRHNPGVVVYLHPRRHRGAYLTAEYLNGKSHNIRVEGCKAEQICGWVAELKSRSGNDVLRFRKQWHTDNPSIQGHWQPFVNKDSSLNVEMYPSEKLSQFIPHEESGTKTIVRLLEETNKLSISNKNSSEVD